MASIGGIKQRTGAIDAETRQQAIANFQRFASMHLGTVEIDPADFRTAAVLIESPAALRAGDALHLAVARRLGARSPVSTTGCVQRLSCWACLALNFRKSAGCNSCNGRDRMNLNINIDKKYYKPDSIEHGRVIMKFLTKLMRRVYVKAHRSWQVQLKLTGNPELPLLYNERNLYSIFASAIDEITPVHLSEWSFENKRVVDFWCMHAYGEKGKVLNYFIELKKNYYCLSEGTQEEFATDSASVVSKIDKQVDDLKKISPDWGGDGNVFLGIIVTHGYHSTNNEPAYDETHVRDNIYNLLDNNNATPQMLFSTWTLPRDMKIQWGGDKCKFISMSAIAMLK